MNNKIEFELNGKKVMVQNQPNTLMLVDYLRYHVGLTGTKVGCGEGGCGSCVVNIQYNQNNNIVNKSINSCLTPLHSVAGSSITTIEGLGGEKSGHFHPIQEKLAEKHGSQCGFCSPGMCMTMYSYLNNTKNPSAEDAELQLDGNLCRCTGYRPIFDTIKSLCTTDIEDLGRNKPCNLQPRQAFHSEFNGQHYHRVNSLSEYQKLNGKNIQLIAGATSRGIYKDEFEHPVLVDINTIPELNQISFEKDGVKFGASTSISKFMDLLKELNKKNNKPQYYSQIIDHITKVAGTPVRNNATIGGNIALQSKRPDFPSDIVPILTAMQATVTLFKDGSTKDVPIQQALATAKDSLVHSVYIPHPGPNEHFLSYKVAFRHQNSHAYVNHCFRFVLDETKSTITDVSVVFGAVMHNKQKFTKVEDLLKGKQLTSSLLEEAVELVNQEIQPTESDGHVAYKKQLATNLFFKSLLKVYSMANEVDKKLESAVNSFQRPVSFGKQSYGEVDDIEKPLGHPIPKLEAKIQASGEATYTDDVAAKNRLSLFGAYVVAEVAAGKVKSIDISKAKEVEGYVNWVTYKDVPGDNKYKGMMQEIDTIFVEEEVLYQGSLIGIIVCESSFAAQKAANLVKVEYDTAGYTPITNLKEGIARQSFMKSSMPTEMKRGDPEKTFEDPSLEIIEGEIEFGSQYAFYMEPQVAYAEIGDNKTTIVHASIQDHSFPQTCIANALGVPKNKVELVTKRIGGAFGSKFLQALRTAVGAAVCAHKTGSPVAIALDRHTDMINVGKRHPIFSTYKASVDKKTGRIIGIKMKLYTDCGYGTDFSPYVLFMAELHFESCYFLENVHVEGQLVKTNLPNNTAVRTFGAIQAYYSIETITNHISQRLNIPLQAVQEANFYKPGQTTALGAPIIEPDYTLPYVWPEAVANSLYAERLKQVEIFNSENRWRKRGISIMPMRFSTSFAESKHGAEMHVYSDGSVVVGTSGVDMGQGLNTKVVQTVAHYLGVPLEKVNLMPTDNFHVANGSFTAGSIGSHSAMIASKAACDIIHERLAPFRKAKPDASWEELCKFAIDSGAHLSVSGWTVRGKIVENGKPLTPSDVPKHQGEPTPLDYNSYGVSVTEVEIDVLTGEVHVLDAYVYYDTGKSANPAIDLGQVEGGYTMGLGNVLTEEVTVSPDGIQLNDSTWTYKIPSSLDIPIKSSINLFSKVPHQRGMLRSKAASEGPMCLAISAFFAVKNAIMSARKEAGVTGWFNFAPPALPHNILAHTETKLEHLKITKQLP